MSNHGLPNGKTQMLGYALVVYGVGCLVLVLSLTSKSLVTSTGMAIVPKPDFSTFERVENKKSAFFEFLTPLVETENAKLAQQRQQLLAIHSDFVQSGSLSRLSEYRLQRLRQQFRLEDEELSTKELLDKLLLRVDEVPLPMVLAQAAIESAWGTSRFAVKANNYFGQWCFKKGCGLVPNQRSEGAYHEVAKFKSVRASVASYMRNLNTHNAYRQLRQKRANLRNQGQVVTSLALIEELKKYSERGEDYIHELRQIISVNQLAELERAPDKA